MLQARWVQSQPPAHTRSSPQWGSRTSSPQTLAPQHHSLLPLPHAARAFSPVNISCLLVLCLVFLLVPKGGRLPVAFQQLLTTNAWSQHDRGFSGLVPWTNTLHSLFFTAEALPCYYELPSACTCTRVTEQGLHTGSGPPGQPTKSLAVYYIQPATGKSQKISLSMLREPHCDVEYHKMEL